MEPQKILLVDDSSTYRMIAKKELVKGGFSILEAEDGNKALSLLKDHEVDLITLDVEMPGIDGFDTFQKMIEENFFADPDENQSAGIPVIFVTSNDTLEEREKGFRVGGTDFITKPFPPGELLASVNRILQPDRPFTGLTVLIVDDSVPVQCILTNLLQEPGLIVLEAEDGRQAYEIAREKYQDIDLVITDVIMPHMDGETLCRKIREELGLRDIPIFFLSVLKEKNRILDMFNAGATDYLIKPFTKEELIARIQVHLTNHHLKKELKQKVLELGQLNKMKDEFLAICSHDLKTPLGTISGYTDLMLMDEVGRGEQMQMLKNIKSSGEFLLNMINDLLDLQRLQGEDSKSFDRKPISIVKAARICLNNFQPMAAAKSISLKLDNRSNGDPIISGNQNVLKRIINNLLSNAIKFTHKKGQVTLAIESPSDEEVILKVTDAGIGIPEESLLHIFDKFSKVSRFGTEGEPGTGLGMAIVKELVEKHDGEIEVESEVGKGTCFTLYLPTVSESLAATQT